jgi:hypothetical protein
MTAFKEEERCDRVCDCWALSEVLALKACFCYRGGGLPVIGVRQCNLLTVNEVRYIYQNYRHTGR